VQDQGRHVELLQILGGIRFRERLDAEIRCREARAADRVDVPPARFV